MTLGLLPLRPAEHHTVWAGSHFGAGRRGVGELCALSDELVVTSCPDGGRPLRDLAADHAEALLGLALVRKYGEGLPLMVKLLSLGEWTSVQVHPDDAQAARLAGASGKTEAWHILCAEPGARLVYGLQPQTTRADLLASLRTGTLDSLLRYVPAHAGETFLVPAGMVHAQGPGILLYEVEQHSALTYRLYDWDRPGTPGRSLHVEECLAVVDCEESGAITRASDAGRDGCTILATSSYFELLIVRSVSAPRDLSTAGRVFHALTAVAKRVTVESAESRYVLRECETLLVPASTGDYTLRTESGGACLVAVPR